MSHMRLFATYMCAYAVECTDGSTDFVPSDLLLKGFAQMTEEEALTALTTYCEGKPESWTEVSGWFARYSAPGYLDCTSWVGPYTTEREAVKECQEMYGDDETEETETEEEVG